MSIQEFLAAQWLWAVQSDQLVDVFVQRAEIPEGRDYPWGNEWQDGICNSEEAKLGVTSPVGLFPRSRSLEFGLEDMAGNVWEWCQDKYSPDSSGRVLRGGSFDLGADNCRSAFRYFWQPDNRNDDIGFRVSRTYN